MWVVSSVNFRPPFVSVRLPPAAIVIEPSTVYTIPVQTCAVLITQFPLIAGPAWSHVCAVAGGANRDRAPMKLPMAVKTTIKTLTDVRASEPRDVMAHTSDTPPPSLQAGAGGLRLRWHSFRAMQGVFI